MPAPRAVAVFLVLVLVSLSCLAANAAPGYAATSVEWPVATGPLIAEVVTGGASASDEYVEIANAGPTTVDLGGLELVYATATGATVTRKASFAGPLPLESGRHLLVANASGTFASIADATYTGGVAADGGALVLRTTGGSVVDAVGWGTATNTFVESRAAPAPPARSGIERLPGGALGNGTDTNDNAADFAVQPAPVPQSLASDPVPPPTETPSDTPSTEAPSETPTPEPTPSSEPTPSVAPTLSPTPNETPTPSASPTPEITPLTSATPSPMPEPTATATPAPTAPATPEPTPTEAPTPTDVPATTPRPTEPPFMSIAAARDLPDGSAVTLGGVLTTRLGVLDGGRGGFVQDGTAGIGLYLAAAPAATVPAGSQVTMTGVVGERYGQRIVRVDADGLTVAEATELPAALTLATGLAGETYEGCRVVVTGVITATPDALADGTGLWLDDASGPVRVVATGDATAGVALGRGLPVMAVGPLGQRASGTTPGYRILVTEPGSLVVMGVEPTPTTAPSASATASPSPEPTAEVTPVPSPSVAPSDSATPEPTPPATGSPSPTPAPTATAAPTATPDDVVTIALARSMSPGERAHVRGVVTLPPGFAGAPELVAIQDGTAGLFVRLPAAMDGLVVGREIEVSGEIAAPYGQLELRTLDRLVTGGLVAPPDTAIATVAALGEGTEGALVAVQGTVADVAVDDDGRLDLTLADGDATIRVYAVAATALFRADAPRGERIVVTGVAGQRATHTGAEDGYRIWLRDRADLRLVEPTSSASPSPSPSAEPTGPVPSATPSAEATPTPSGTPSVTATADPTPAHTASPTATSSGPQTIARVRGMRGANVEIEAAVTVPVGLFECGGPTIVVEDATGAIAAVVPPQTQSLAIGARIRLKARVGTWQTTPRLLATAVQPLGETAAVVPRRVLGSLTPDLEWRLVVVSGRIEKVTRIGTRWSADVLVNGKHVGVLGEPAAGIASATLSKGRLLTVAGVVRRASDRTSFRLLPRIPGDLRLGPSLVSPTGRPGYGPRTGADGSGAAGRNPDVAGGGPGRVEVARLAEHVGRVVTVSGLIAETETGDVTVDDGTGQAPLTAEGDAAAEIELLEPGDAVEATGTVERLGTALELVVGPGGIVALSAELTDAAEPSAAPGLVDPASLPSALDAPFPGGSAVDAGSGAALRAGDGTAQPGSPAPLVAAAATLAAALAALLWLRLRPHPLAPAARGSWIDRIRWRRANGVAATPAAQANGLDSAPSPGGGALLAAEPGTEPVDGLEPRLEGPER